MFGVDGLFEVKKTYDVLEAQRGGSMYYIDGYKKSFSESLKSKIF
jgi:hypothetical protein